MAFGLLLDFAFGFNSKTDSGIDCACDAMRCWLVVFVALLSSQ